jgi:hypothetical protein
MKERGIKRARPRGMSLEKKEETKRRKLNTELVLKGKDNFIDIDMDKDVLESPKQINRPAEATISYKSEIDFSK